MNARIFSTILLIAFFGISFCSAQSLPTYQDLYVNDFGHVLNASQATELRDLFSGIKSSTTAEVVFVSVNSTEPDVPSQYRTELFNAWHIGNKDKDNGLLILYAVQEHRIEVEVGYGLEGILPDSKVGRLLDDNYVPLRDQGDVPKGIVTFSHAIGQVIMENAGEVSAGKAGADDSISWQMILLVIGILILVLYVRIKFGGGGYVGSSGFGGGGSFGGGGGSFGGGGSGGGGAGR